MSRLLDPWYPLIPHPTQLALVNDKVRFKVCAAGRRSGKSERARRHVVREALRKPGDYFIAAPTYAQTKAIHWLSVKALSFAPILPRAPSESELCVYFPNGSTIRLIGLDKASRFEGVPWSGGILDEIADIRDGAWASNIRPALDTVDPSRGGELAWCWLIGVPNGVGDQFHELALYAQSGVDPDWCFYHWKSSEILPEDVVEAARCSLSPLVFRQEYEAAFEGAQGRIYADYSDLNITQETIQPHEQLCFAHDFNFTPQSSCIIVRRGPSFMVLDEIVLRSATARMAALEFVERYKTHQNRKVIVYGDPAGKAGEKHGIASNYTEMEQVLRAADWQVERRVRAAAPAIIDRQNAVRAHVCNAAGERRLFVNAAKCKYAHKGMSTVSLKEGSAFLEEPSEWQHITTAIGYMIEREAPVRPEARKPEPAMATVHHWPAAGQWGPRSR